jgi:membrane-associated phospholipid phosphatase
MPRPICTLTLSNNLNIIRENINCFHSFPSAHCAFGTLFAASLWSYSNKFTKIVLALIVAATALSRIILAMHYPADVIYGISITLLLTAAGSKIINAIFNKPAFVNYLCKKFKIIKK